ncbi:MAG: M20/M25/M40 family metallo-hydrolase [Candidatus Latescibacteria bacterium]|nr:M20/M25/M40 family metallo-hydrolase [bacterium]MBD3423491.1 M20/M25/M40 family metallo-hydrolase [Candidatus Latescibacterota bacterium]
MDRIEKMMKEFTEASGVSGDEGEVFSLMEKHLAGAVEVSRDKLGSFIGKLSSGPDEPRIMLAGHMDEVGMMVSHFSDNYIKFNPVGGWWTPRMIGLPVRIKAAERVIPGVIASKSPFQMEADQRKKIPKKKELFIDIGLNSDEKVEEQGIRPGDPVVPDVPFTPLINGNTYMAKAWDNRIGCMAVVEVLRRLSKKSPPCAVYGVGTVQEEVGLRGAETSVHYVNPDVCLAVDVGIAQDIPGAPRGGMDKLGKGVSISVYDASLIPNRALRDLVVSVAEKEKIEHYFSATPYGGTDGGKFHLSRAGVPTIVMSVPTRYIHSGGGILDRRDFESTVELLAKLIMKLDSDTVSSLA